jgi:hypothetical protein
MRPSLFIAIGLLVSGCEFDVSPLADAAVPLDGAVDAADGAVPDLLTAPDLHEVPDGVLPGALGWPCASPVECATGFCVDGFCCDGACDPATNLCKACNVSGQEGHCTLASAGTDPRSQCNSQPQATCGRDGQCDGAGQCRLWTAGTTCGAASCSGGVVTYAPACDGTGTCVAGTSASCYPYTCADATQCTTSCSSAAQCAGGIVCSAMSCGKRADGQPCALASDCQSNHCEQGVCCASACSSTCLACNLMGSLGTCTAVPAGLDPLGQCAQSPRSSCGQDGKCDGSGACRLWAAGTSCAAQACSGDFSLSARACDGAGTCAAGLATSCTPYTCDPKTVTCFAAPCSDSTQCASGKTCNLSNGKCH